MVEESIEYKAMFEYILYVCISLEPYSYLQNYLNLKIYGTPSPRIIFFYSNTFFIKFFVPKSF
jgi:hypothetical protein